MLTRFGFPHLEQARAHQARAGVAVQMGFINRWTGWLLADDPESALQELGLPGCVMLHPEDGLPAAWLEWEDAERLCYELARPAQLAQGDERWSVFPANERHGALTWASSGHGRVAVLGSHDPEAEAYLLSGSRAGALAAKQKLREAGVQRVGRARPRALDLGDARGWLLPLASSELAIAARSLCSTSERAQTLEEASAMAAPLRLGVVGVSTRAHLDDIGRYPTTPLLLVSWMGHALHAAVRSLRPRELVFSDGGWLDHVCARYMHSTSQKLVERCVVVTSGPWKGRRVESAWHDEAMKWYGGATSLGPRDDLAFLRDLSQSLPERVTFIQRESRGGALAEVFVQANGVLGWTLDDDAPYGLPDEDARPLWNKTSARRILFGSSGLQEL